MIFVNSISDLSYYHPLPLNQCYCELVLAPRDLVLQAPLDRIPTSEYTRSLTVRAYEPDGVTLIGDVTSAFEWIFFQLSGNEYFTLRAKYFHSLLCANKCFVLRVTATAAKSAVVPFNVFDKYTERWCLHDCCVAATQVAIDGTVYTTEVETETPVAPTDYCGRPIVTLQVRFDCLSFFDGHVYGIPSGSTSGSTGVVPFSYEKKTHQLGRFFRQPRTISRTISRNCKTQRSESARKWTLEVVEVLPEWKVDELENMLHAPHIYLNGTEYMYRGGDDAPLQRLFPNPCKDGWKMQVDFEQCQIFQLFGCGDDCNGGVVAYGFLKAPEDGNYYDDGGRKIAGSFDGLVTYLRNQPGVAEVIDYSPNLPVNYYKILEVSGPNVITGAVYSGGRTAAYKVYGKRLTDISQYNNLFNGITRANQCSVPSFGTPTAGLMGCALPAFGTPVSGLMAASSVGGTPYGRWSGTVDVAKAGNTAILSVNLFNTDYPQPPEKPAVFVNEPLARLGLGALPAANQTIIASADNSLPAGTTIVIDTDGTVRYYGNALESSEAGSTIAFGNVRYQLMNQSNTF